MKDVCRGFTQMQQQEVVMRNKASFYLRVCRISFQKGFEINNHSVTKVGK
jgi:hypothetical protein